MVIMPQSTTSKKRKLSETDVETAQHVVGMHNDKTNGSLSPKKQKPSKDKNKESASANNSDTTKQNASSVQAISATNSSTTSATTTNTSSSTANVEAIKEYLQDKNGVLNDEPLQEDDLHIEMVQTHQVVFDRLRYRPDSDEQQAYTEEMGFSLDQVFFKELCHKTNADKRTINWLRRKVGWNELTEAVSGPNRYYNNSSSNGMFNEHGDFEKRKTRGMRKVEAQQKSAQHQQQQLSQDSQQQQQLQLQQHLQQQNDETSGIIALQIAMGELEDSIGLFANTTKRGHKTSKPLPTSSTKRKHSLLLARRDLNKQSPKVSRKRPRPSPSPATKTSIIQHPHQRRRLLLQQQPKSKSARIWNDQPRKYVKSEFAPSTALIGKVYFRDGRSSTTLKPHKAATPTAKWIRVTKLVVGGVNIIVEKKNGKNDKLKITTPVYEKRKKLTSRKNQLLPLRHNREVKKQQIPQAMMELKNVKDPNEENEKRREKKDAKAKKKEKKEQEKRERRERREKEKKERPPKPPRLLTSPLSSLPPTPRLQLSKLLKIRKDAGNASEPRKVLFSPTTPISLGLLQWRRRQQWTPSKDDPPSILQTEEDENEGIIKVNATLEASGIETKLPSWLAINELSEMSRQPPMVDPPREAHTDIQYATWCTRLINFLNGSGRSWARHEFFYSDLDRPWFNFSDFHVDLAKIGVSPHSKFTRSEWSLIRRQIRRRPRRFSQRFIREQMISLNEYRKVARRVQNTAQRAPNNFAYSVPALIAIGSTVTAYNRKYRILHRGIVLAYDMTRCMYLIQFERKELGFEFCFDSEVASHGVPEYKQGAKEVTLGGTLNGGFADLNHGLGDISYGTCYALTKNSWQMQRKGLSLDPHTDVSDSEGDFLRRPKDPDAKMDRDELEDKVAERESVVKLLEVLQKGIKRKQLLLDAIKLMNSEIKSLNQAPLRANHHSLGLASHYSWLHANLESTDRVLEAAMAHLQVMYTNPIVESKSSMAVAEREKSLNAVTEYARDKQMDKTGNRAFAPWASALLEGSKLAGQGIISSKKDTGVEETLPPRKQYMEYRLGQAASFLMATQYVARELRAPIPVAKNDAATSLGIDSVTNLAMKWLQPHPMTQRQDVAAPSSKLLKALSQRTKAVDDLREALSGFQSEFALLHSGCVHE